MREIQRDLNSRTQPEDGMNLDTNDLSGAQQAILRQLARKLAGQVATEFIFCFSMQCYEVRYTHCFTSRDSRQWVKADILLVYNDYDQCCPHDIQHRANNVDLGKHQYTAVVMTYTDVMRRLAAADGFVCKVFQHGALLYSRTHVLPRRNVFVCHETLLQQTREGWRRWFNNSCQFMDCAVYCLMECKFSMAVFMIHQTVEQACKAMLKVMLYMRPNSHNLAWMLKLCSTLAPEIASVFPRETPQDKALFDLLKSSYMDSRYATGFTVKEEEGWALYYRASSLLRIAGELCNRRIAELEAWVAAPRSTAVQ